MPFYLRKIGLTVFALASIVSRDFGAGIIINSPQYLLRLARQNGNMHNAHDMVQCASKFNYCGYTKPLSTFRHFSECHESLCLEIEVYKLSPL